MKVNGSVASVSTDQNKSFCGRAFDYLMLGIKPKGGGLDFLAILTLRSVNLRHSFMHRAFLECLLCASQWGFIARMGSETQTI